MTDSLIEEIAKALALYSDTPYLDARFFCEEYQNQPSKTCIDDFINRRQKGEPVSKIIGKRGFWKRDFIVSKAVLDPRPDSETLIEAVLKYYPDKTKSYRILDIGTGSGCLLHTLLDEYPQARGVGVDKSPEALAVAEQNKTTQRAELLMADFMTNTFASALGRFDIILSNPPYIRTDDIALLEKNVRDYDPLLALDGGADGLTAYRQLSKILPHMLYPNGQVFFEIGQGQENDVCTLMQQHHFECVAQIKDLGGIIRVLVFKQLLLCE